MARARRLGSMLAVLAISIGACGTRAPVTSAKASTEERSASDERAVPDAHAGPDAEPARRSRLVEIATSVPERAPGPSARAEDDQASAPARVPSQTVQQLPPSTIWVRITKDEIQVGPGWSMPLRDPEPDDASIRDPRAPSPELISALESVYPQSAEGPQQIFIIGTRDLHFDTLVMVLKAAKEAGFVNYAFTVENDDGTIPETTPEPKALDEASLGI